MALNVEVGHDKYIILSLVPLGIMLAAMFVGGQSAQIAFSFAAILFIGLYVLIGTQSIGDRYSERPFQLLVGGLLLILGVGFALLWYFHFQNPEYTDPTYWLGFPRATAIVIYLLWMPPALYLMFSYPYLFEKYIWSDQEAKRFREESMQTATTDSGDKGGETQ